MDNNQALHDAIRENDMEMFLDLLNQPGIDLNVRHIVYTDQTPLLRSIREHRYAMAKHLIKAGCDVNLTDSWKGSPLEDAIPWEHCEKFDKLELVSTLLYYGADANVTKWYGQTPIMNAFQHCNKEVAELLLNYYDDFFWKTYGGDILRYATEMESPLVIGLVERRADVNWRNTRGQCLLNYTQYNRNAATFKFIWSRINHETLLNVNRHVAPILSSYLKCPRRTSNSEYFECLYLMLESPIAYLLIQDCINYHDNSKYYRGSFVSDVLYMFYKRNVLPNDRLPLIYLFLSFGVDVIIEDLQCAYKLYGFNEEFKAILYAGNFNYYDFTEQIRHCKTLKEDYYTKGFSSLSLEKKQHLISQLPNFDPEDEQVLEGWNKVPEFPSLLELSRNEAQKFVHENFEVTKLYQFYDAVNCLELPQVMKDVILFEKPIYANFLVSHKN